jgi:hypothetical protein
MRVSCHGEFNITETDATRRRIQMEDANALTRRIFDGRQAGVPAFSSHQTIFWSLEVAAPFGGLSAYVARVVEVISETNAVYPFDARVLSQRADAAKKAAQKEARRAEAEKILAMVKDALGG